MLQLGNTKVICPECGNDRNFNHANLTSSGGRCDCGRCGVTLIINGPEITVRR